MPKKKLKKRSKKRSQKKQKKQQKEEKNELPEVDKELYEIQISDLNSKLQRLKQQCVDLEKENSDIKESLTQLNADRADVIAYLSRVLKSKTEDIVELQEQVTTLQQSREFENSAFSEKFRDKENELKKLQEQLTTEINLLNGKLNVLDEFRIQKDELMKKFQFQEETQKSQELKHQETLHNIERDFIMKKLRMKKEVEERLIKLSEDFQTIMQTKIDATTKVTIAENNTFKTEMKKLMNTCKELIKENNELKSEEREIKIKYTLLREELDESIRKYIRKDKELQELLVEDKMMKSVIHTDTDVYVQQIRELTDSLEEYKINLRRQISINEELKEKISLYQQQENILNENLKVALTRVERVESVIRCAATAIMEILLAEGQKTEINNDCRTVFVSSLLEILKTAKIEGYEEIFQFKIP